VITYNNSPIYFGIGFPNKIALNRKNIFVFQVDLIIKLKAKGVGKESVDAEEAILTALMKKLAVAEGKDPEEKGGISKELKEEKGKK